MLRSVAVRLARSGCGPVEYWLGLPIDELLRFMLELTDQLNDEAEAIKRG